MTYSNEHLQVNLIEQNDLLCDTPQFPMPQGQTKSCWRDKKMGEQRGFLFCFCLFPYFVLIFSCLLGGCCRGEEKIQGNWEVSRIRMYNVKFPKSLPRNYVQ